MQNEERDTYIIPPNFIEGGTLLGGMFKVRNVIEAGILGAATGLPMGVLMRKQYCVYTHSHLNQIF